MNKSLLVSLLMTGFAAGKAVILDEVHKFFAANCLPKPYQAIKSNEYTL